GLGGLLELLLGRGIGVAIGVVLERELAIRLLQLALVRVPIDAEHLVVITLHDDVGVLLDFVARGPRVRNRCGARGPRKRTTNINSTKAGSSQPAFASRGPRMARSRSGGSFPSAWNARMWRMGT